MGLTAHVKDVCKIGQGKDCCRYLMVGGNGFECGKLTVFKPIIDARVRKMSAKSDNCEGIVEENFKQLNDDKS